MNKYHVEGIVGEGAYGVVLRCKNKLTNETMAIKKFKESEDDDVVRKTTLREVKILRMLKHPNVVALHEAFRRKGKLYLVFEYLEKNLLEVLEERPTGLEAELVRRYIFQLCLAIEFCHRNGVIHRDIKPENLLVNSDHTLKLCDFGFARTVQQADRGSLTDYVATRWYRAPELLLGSTDYTLRVDTWAIGCIMGELIDGQPLFPGESEIDQLYVIQQSLGSLTEPQLEAFKRNPRFAGMKFPEIRRVESLAKRYGRKVSRKGVSFLKAIMQLNPDRRLSSRECVLHPYFDGLLDEFGLKREDYVGTQADPLAPAPPRSANPVLDIGGGGGSGGGGVIALSTPGGSSVAVGGSTTAPGADVLRPRDPRRRNRGGVGGGVGGGSSSGGGGGGAAGGDRRRAGAGADDDHNPEPREPISRRTRAGAAVAGGGPTGGGGGGGSSLLSTGSFRRRGGGGVGSDSKERDRSVERRGRHHHHHHHRREGRLGRRGAAGDDDDPTTTTTTTSTTSKTRRSRRAGTRAAARERERSQREKAKREAELERQREQRERERERERLARLRAAEQERLREQKEAEDWDQMLLEREREREVASKMADSAVGGGGGGGVGSSAHWPGLNADDDEALGIDNLPIPAAASAHIHAAARAIGKDTTKRDDLVSSDFDVVSYYASRRPTSGIRPRSGARKSLVGPQPPGGAGLGGIVSPKRLNGSPKARVTGNTERKHAASSLRGLTTTPVNRGSSSGAVVSGVGGDESSSKLAEDDDGPQGIALHGPASGMVRGGASLSRRGSRHRVEADDSDALPRVLSTTHSRARPQLPPAAQPGDRRGLALRAPGPDPVPIATNLDADVYDYPLNSEPVTEAEEATFRSSSFYVAPIPAFRS